MFPSLTFPNHWSMVTGLFPESNGILANRFLDPQSGRTFSYTNATEANDARWWKGEPFWVTAKKAGLKSASYFWPGSEVIGLQPDYVHVYNGNVANTDRIKQVVDWLDMEWTVRPSFITLYLSDVDTAGHRFGPESAEVAAAVKSIDDTLGELLLAIDNEGRQNRLLIDLVIVSDHGMASISVNRTILLDQLINMSTVSIPDLGGPMASIWPSNSTTVEEVVASLQRECACAGERFLSCPSFLTHSFSCSATPLTVYRKKDIPEDYHFRNNPNVAPIIAVADVGWMITTSEMRDSNPSHYNGGSHGYDPRLREMHGILVAYGPHIRNTENNYQISGPLHNTQVYNLLSCIFQIAPAPNNGTSPCEPGILTERVMRAARFRKDPAPSAP